MRLTEEIRLGIKRAVLEHAFEQREEDLQKRRLKMGEALYKALIGPHVRALRRLPPEWCSPESRIEVRTPQGERVGFPLKSSRIFPGNSQWLRLIVPAELEAEVMEIARDAERLKKDRRERGQEVVQVLRGVPSLARLVEIWPEIESVIPASIRERGQLPVPADVARLNQELGLAAPGRSN